MSEDEAEAVLLALGPRLEWSMPRLTQRAHIAAGHWWENATVKAGNGYLQYSIGVNPDFAPQVKVMLLYVNKDGRADTERNQSRSESDSWDCWYNSLAEAKAACEIHAATGAFPPDAVLILPAPWNQAQGDWEEDAKQ